jgi:protein-tyrosine phosphatase
METLIDLHTHILPGLDDGSSSLQESQQMLEIAAADGISVLFATPHFMEGWFQPSPEIILSEVQQLNDYAIEKGLPIRVMPGMEVALCQEIPRWLGDGRLLTLNGQGKHLLVELPANEIPNYTEPLLFELQLMGITPILAHPERNRIVGENPSWISRLVERGVLVQITGDSLLGRFGKRTLQTARQLLNLGVVHGLGSDAHSSRHRVPILSKAKSEVFNILSPYKVAGILRPDFLGIPVTKELLGAQTTKKINLQQNEDSKLYHRLLNVGQSWIRQMIGV